jgi:hypothetical protein
MADGSVGNRYQMRNSTYSSISNKTYIFMDKHYHIINLQTKLHKLLLILLFNYTINKILTLTRVTIPIHKLIVFERLYC